MRLKPHMLVDVSERGTLITEVHYYVGEVMSFPTPEKTVMVRRAPGCPSTLVELPLADVQRNCWRQALVTYALCMGRGAFPVDMLRYDNAVPVNFKLLPHAYKGVEVELEPGQDVPIIAVASQSDKLPFTPERWRSFLWNIKILKTERVVA